MNPNEQDKLEASVHQLLRRLPDRKAPTGLERRVLAEIARRAALPWWKKSFAYWPAPARLGFFVGSAAAAGLVVSVLFVVSGSAGAHELAGGISNSFGWLSIAREILASAESRVQQLTAQVPSLWLYAIGGTVVACYAALGAIGAAAYRTFSVARQAP
jgi:hypothetical protein